MRRCTCRFVVAVVVFAAAAQPVAAGRPAGWVGHPTNHDVGTFVRSVS